MLMSRQAVQAYLSRDFDSYEWLKTLPADKLWKHINGLPVRPVFKTQPWLHQLVCFYIGYCCPEFLFLLGMGHGKSKIVLDLMTQALRESRHRRAHRGLVTVPRLINLESWQQAAADHSILEPWIVTSGSADEKFEQLRNPRGDFTVVDYPGLHMACTVKKATKKGNKLVIDPAKVKVLQGRYDFVALDESHKLGNTGTLWHAICEALCSTASFRYACTGTLFSRKNMLAIPAQFRLVDGGKTFGDNNGLFTSAFFTAKPDAWKGQVLTYNRDMSKTLNAMLGHRSITYKDREIPEIDLPSVVSRVRYFVLPEEQHEHYMLALEGLINASGQMEEMKAQWFRMRQITSGYLQWRDGFGDHEVIFKENPKLDHLESLVLDDLGDQKLVVSCEYTRTGRLITDMLARNNVGHAWLYGGTKDPIKCKKQFMDDDACQVLVMNSEAGGTGVDGLQKVCHQLVLYESPSHPNPRQQVVKRVHRPGQRQRTYITDFAVRGTVDTGILQTLQDDIDLYERIMAGQVDRAKLLG